jgi:DNA replication protein DnaC
MKEAINRSKEFDIAFQFITQTNKNLFLTGKAGTGKTTFLKYLKTKTHKSVVTAAPTGVAAINAGGVTLHSLFQLPFAPYIPVEEPGKNTLSKHPLLSQIRLNTLKRRVLKNMDLLVIDEVSMVASNTIDAIDVILKSVRKNFNYPFGGVQVLFIGDLRQLPPVIKNINSSVFNTIYPSYFFFDSIILKQYTPVIIELKTIYRQQDDVFVDILNAVRENKLLKSHINTLNKRLKKGFQPNHKDGYITLTTHNSQANQINETQINRLKEKEFVFEAKIKDNFPESMYPAEKKMLLKRGAQVMFLKNDTEEKKYFNGKIGIIEHLTNNEIIVKCEGDLEPIEVKEHKWENVHYKINESTRDVEQQTLGFFVQFPLRLAWGITIHKSQGLTFNKLIVDAQKAFANGQVYVALSRVRSLKGLILTSPISQKYLGPSNNIQNWEEHNNQPEKLPALLENSKIECIRTECLRIFDWSIVVKAISDINKSAKNNNEHLDQEVQNWTYELLNQITEVNTIVKKFQKTIYKLTTDPDFNKNQSIFQKRLKDSAEYFQPQIDLLKDKVLNHPIICKTKKTAEQFDESLEEVGRFIDDISNQFNYLSKGTFNLSIYLREWRVNKKPQIKIKKTYLTKKKKSKSLVSAIEIKHIDLYQEIALYRKEKSEQTSIPIYRVFSNKALKEICEFLPKTEDSLLLINGIGPKNVEMYGEDLVSIIVDYCKKNNIQPKSLFG